MRRKTFWLLTLAFCYLIAVSTLQAQTLLKIEPVFDKQQKKRLLRYFKEAKRNSDAPSRISYEKGWNLFIAPAKGIDVPRSFQKSGGVEIVTFDPVSKSWAVFPSRNENTTLSLESIEGGIPFFILAKQGGKAELFPIKITQPCQEIFRDNRYETLEVSALKEGFTKNVNETFYAKSRYRTHHQKGTYKDTRILIAIPKIHTQSTSPLYRYGPAIPKSYFLFSKAYAGKFFYIFSYHDKKCYKGVFPSPKIPPFPFLKSYD